MLQLSLRPDIVRLRRDFRDLKESQFNAALVRAINRTTTSTRAKALKDTRAMYKVKRARIARETAKHLARRGATVPTGTIVTTGLPIPLMAFGARANKKGVSVDVAGTRKTIKSAFIATMKSGHKGVFARGEYGKKGFEFRNKRTAQGDEFRLIAGRWVPINAPDLPVTEMSTLSTAAAMGRNIETNEPDLLEHIQTTFVKRFEHELLRARGGSTSELME